MNDPLKGSPAASADRFETALKQAEEDLAEEPEKAERLAKALTAVVKAARDVQEWRAGVMASSEGRDESAAARRAFEARINRMRGQSQLEPLFADPEQE